MEGEEDIKRRVFQLQGTRYNTGQPQDIELATLQESKYYFLVL